MSDTNAIIDVGEIDPKTGRPKLSWSRDAEIWAPCRLGEAFTLREFRSERTQYLYSIKASWMGQHGEGASVPNESQLAGEYQHPIRVGIGPRPWACCWTYEPKIKITPPVWCWEMQEDTMFGLELKPKRNGSRRKAKLDCVMIHKGRPVYCIVVETSDGESRWYYDSIPALDPYFAPIWPATADEPEAVAEPTPEPVADPVAEPLATVGKVVESVGKVAESVIETPETVTNAQEPEQTGPEAEQTGPEAEQTPDSEKCTDVANLPTPAKCTENRPPGACIGGQTPINGNYYYYVWFEEPPTEGEAYEQKADP